MGFVNLQFIPEKEKESISHNLRHSASTWQSSNQQFARDSCHGENNVVHSTFHNLTSSLYSYRYRIRDSKRFETIHGNTLFWQAYDDSIHKDLQSFFCDSMRM